MIKINAKLPKFKLLNQDSEEVSSKDLDGMWTILYFYPKAMTPGCTVQACGIRDSEKQFKKAKVKIYGVSPDLPTKLLKFIEKENLNFELLSDPEFELANAFGVYGLKKFMGREYMGVLRTTFIISPDGKIAYVMDDVKTKTHHTDILNILKEIQ